MRSSISGRARTSRATSWSGSRHRFDRSASRCRASSPRTSSTSWSACRPTRPSCATTPRTCTRSSSACGPWVSSGTTRAPGWGASARLQGPGRDVRPASLLLPHRERRRGPEPATRDSRRQRRARGPRPLVRARGEMASKAAIIESAGVLDLRATKELLETRPSLLAVTDCRGFNLLHLASAASTTDLGLSPALQVRYVDFLLDRGFEIDSPVGRDRYARPCSSRWPGPATPPLVRRLLARGAKTSAPLRATGCSPPAGGRTSRSSTSCSRPGRARSRRRRDAVPRLLVLEAVRPGREASRRARRGRERPGSRRGGPPCITGIEKEFDPSLLAWLVQTRRLADIPDRGGCVAREQNVAEA